MFLHHPYPQQLRSRSGRCPCSTDNSSKQQICLKLPATEMVSNPALDDIRYKEGLTCMNKGMYEAAIELFCSLAEEW